MKREEFNNFIGNMVLFLGILLILPLYLLCVVLLFPVRVGGLFWGKIKHRFFPGLRVWGWVYKIEDILGELLY